LKEAEFGAGKGECALGGEMCDEVGTDENEEMGRVSAVFLQCRVSVPECLFFWRKDTAL